LRPGRGRNHVGLKVDKRSDLLYVTGGTSKAIYVYDSETGDDVRTYALPPSGFVNDVVVTKRAVYATDFSVQHGQAVPRPVADRALARDRAGPARA